MIKGLYSAASGMLAIEARQDVVANNIANAATPGYKRQELVQLGFYDIFSDKMRNAQYFNMQPAPAGGVKQVETFPDVAQGMLQDTGQPLQLGLMGPGFFVVDTPAGERYTRSGDFSIDVEGHLATLDGFKIQSTSGQPIDVRGGTPVIGNNGNVLVNGILAGEIRTVEFAEPARLTREGSNLYSASEAVLEQRAEAADTTIQQGQIERSNVNVTQEMTKMMLGLRAYEANQRVIQAVDTTIGRLIDQVAVSQ
ncbi:MAG: flagellar hook-basal body protein [Candidatus Hydrogenedentes bacterium]|nr:flagellar hook-basal body protein [Candidatus Hydrogenedentota bacterium]